ncbi:MAG: NYN domain-containing protein [Desulfatirhabdiaceae bacterium]
MSLHIIIDGYNLIRQSDELSILDNQDIQSGREALLEKLAAYRKLKHHTLTVVFDGTHAPAGATFRDTVQGIHIRYSRPGELADAVIKRMAASEKERALIVSSDQDVIRFSQARGCSTIDSLQFEDKLVMAVFMETGQLTDEPASGWTPTTKKKGPSRKLSKKERRNRIKTEKL